MILVYINARIHVTFMSYVSHKCKVYCHHLKMQTKQKCFFHSIPHFAFVEICAKYCWPKIVKYFQVIWTHWPKISAPFIFYLTCKYFNVFPIWKPETLRTNRLNPLKHFAMKTILLANILASNNSVFASWSVNFSRLNRNVEQKSIDIFEEDDPEKSKMTPFTGSWLDRGFESPSRTNHRQ